MAKFNKNEEVVVQDKTKPFLLSEKKKIATQHEGVLGWAPRDIGGMLCCLRPQGVVSRETIIAPSVIIGADVWLGGPRTNQSCSGR